MYVCCLCGQQIRLGQFLIRVQAFVNLREGLDPMILEDGSTSKLAHYLCPPKFGAPMELIGLGTPDV